MWHLFLLCVSDAWALFLGLYGRYFYIVVTFGLVRLAASMLVRLTVSRRSSCTPPEGQADPSSKAIELSSRTCWAASTKTGRTVPFPAEKMGPSAHRFEQDVS